MILEARICPKCGSKGLVPQTSSYNCFCGANEICFPVTEDEYLKMSNYQIDNMIEEMGIKPVISEDDALAIYNATKSTEVIDAMIDLKQKDIIEYNLKLNQFKLQAEQKNSSSSNNVNVLKCPTCSSTRVKKISTTSKVAGAAMFGLFSKTARSQFECEQCGYKW